MLCERCKIREANIQYTEVINGVKREHNLCAQCAKELDFGPYSAIFDSDFPLGKLLSGLLGIGEDSTEEKMNQIVCPTCGTSYEEFVKNSRFGCPDCYGVFDPLISDNIRQLQGSDTHTGKRPKHHDGGPGEKPSASGTAELTGIAVGADADAAERIRLLKAKLSEALAREEYETAAVCRDQIKALQKESEDEKMV